jgi:AraC family transcriptional regulator of adaptative response/methylated-DNA-[protein]-cysteine methyltransferase
VKADAQFCGRPWTTVSLSKLECAPVPTTTRQVKPSEFPSNDAERWQAVALRDVRADDRFVFAVISTGIYCRPSCPARRPLRRNVRFFASNLQAEQAGFRACKRCKPNQASILRRHSQLVAEACARIDASAAPLDLKALANDAQMSATYFQRVFKSVVGISPKQYAAGCRAQALRQNLPGIGTITAAIYDSGFRSSSRFYSSAPGALGMTPKSARSRGRGLTIRYGFGRSTLGQVLVAATHLGVCWISLGEDRDCMRAELEAHFSSATFHKGSKSFDTQVKEVIDLVDGATDRMHLPLDLQGTILQQRVWKELQQIPRGELCTYQELAARIGKTKAIRAVASACAANKLAVAIPCHRVVRSDGSASGYRWGVERKQQLQLQEQMPAGKHSRKSR